MLTFDAPSKTTIDAINRGFICLSVFEEKRPLKGLTGLIDWRLQGYLSQLTISNFLTGRSDELLLLPPGRHLPISHILIHGLGSRETFSQKTFEYAIQHTIDACQGIDNAPINIQLPGRAEEYLDAETAVGWFIDYQERIKLEHPICILDHSNARQPMLNAIEQSRMKSSVILDKP